MSSKPPPSAQPVRAAIAASEPLARLMQRVTESRECLALVLGRLPAGLRQHVRAGPLDERGWALLVPNAAVAAKLRQALPIVSDALREAGRDPGEIRVRILPPTP